MDRLIASRELRNISNNCICTHTRQVSRALSRLYDRALAPTGLKSTQFSILVAVGLHPRSSITELAAAQNLEHTTLTRNMLLLKRDGLVEIQRAKADSRVKLVTLTGKGRRALTRAFPLWKEAQQLTETQLQTRAFAKRLDAFLSKAKK